MSSTTELILGGARSGKSRYAEQCATESGLPVIYLATALPSDDEMKQRIECHQKQRPAYWKTVESPLHLADALERWVCPGQLVLVDCITLWLSQILFSPDGQIDEQRFGQERQKLLAFLAAPGGPLLMVSNEVGSGIVATDSGTRRFVDEAGRLNQAIAALCSKVVLVTAGLPQVLKST